MPALNFLPLPRVSHPKPPAQTDGLPTLPGPWGRVVPEYLLTDRGVGDEHIEERLAGSNAIR